MDVAYLRVRCRICNCFFFFLQKEKDEKKNFVILLRQRLPIFLDGGAIPRKPRKSLYFKRSLGKHRDYHAGDVFYVFSVTVR